MLLKTVGILEEQENMRVFNCKFLVQFIVVQFNLGESRLRIVQDNDCYK